MIKKTYDFIDDIESITELPSAEERLVETEVDAAVRLRLLAAAKNCYKRVGKNEIEFNFAGGKVTLELPALGDANLVGIYPMGITFVDAGRLQSQHWVVVAEDGAVLNEGEGEMIDDLFSLHTGIASFFEVSDLIDLLGLVVWES